MSLLDTIQQQLGPDAVQQLSRRIGADPGTTGNAVDAAVPVLLAALARQAGDPARAPQLAHAIEKDHDGSLLDNLSGMLGGSGAPPGGNGILGHVLGQRRGAVENGIGQTTGLDASKVAQLLPILAPIVMAAIGRAKRERNLDAGGVSTLLTSESEQLKERAPGVMGALGRFLDKDGDGQVMDDVGGILGSVFNRGK